MKVIITMAGAGERFAKSGYTVDKHAIIFQNRTLFEWAILSLTNFFSYEFIFVTRAFEGIEKFIYEKTALSGLPASKIKIKCINSLTRGQAETALLSGEYFASDDSMLIYNIDTYVNPACLKPESIRGNGWIPVFSAPGMRWSFVEADKNDRALRTTEKDRISDLCSIGLYYFSSFEDYKLLVNNIPGKSREWYIAPLYNELIKMGREVYIHRIPSEQVTVLGTPDDLREAERNWRPK